MGMNYIFRTRAGTIPPASLLKRRFAHEWTRWAKFDGRSIHDIVIWIGRDTWGGWVYMTLEAE